MIILSVLILSILFYSPTSLQGIPENPIICNIFDESEDSGSKMLNIDDLPEQCDVFQISQFSFDYNEIKPCNYMHEENLNAIRTLAEANKNIYVLVGYYREMKWEEQIFNNQDKDAYRKTFFEPLIDFLKTYKISGVSIQFPDTYDTQIANIETKISCFVSSIKKEINTLKVGLIIRGYQYLCFPEPTLFDYTITNEVLDFYTVDLGWLNICSASIKQIGMNPIKSTDPNVASYETISCALDSSCIDKSKLYGMVETSVGLPEAVITAECANFTSYSVYCSSSDPKNSSQWCTQSIQTFHDQGVYVKQHYQGIVIQWLDDDDTEGSCNCCQKYPVTNSIIDGWKGNAAVTPCAKIDGCTPNE